MELDKLLSEAERLVSLVFRYVSAGGVAVLCFGFLRGDRFSFLMVGESKAEISWLLTLLVVAVTGLALYGFHRGLPYVVILCILHRWLIHRFSLKIGVVDLEQRLAKQRFERSRQEPVQRRFDALAAEVHFLYIAAWGLLGAVLALMLLSSQTAPGSLLAVLIALVLLAAAIVYDCKLMTGEIRTIPNLKDIQRLSTSEPNNGVQPAPEDGRG